jgi:nicotinamide-nucleotide amidase
VATYARADAVDVRVSAVAENGRTAEQIAAEAEATVLAAFGKHVWGRGGDTWPLVLGRLLDERGWTVAISEIGTGGSAARLLGDAAWLKTAPEPDDGEPGQSEPAELAVLADATRNRAGADVGLAVRTIEGGEDTQVELAAVGPFGTRRSRVTAFLGGTEGRRRAGIAAAAFLNTILRDE